MFEMPIFNSNQFNDPIYHRQINSCNCPVMKHSGKQGQEGNFRNLFHYRNHSCVKVVLKGKIFISWGQMRWYSPNMISQTLTNPNSPGVLFKTKLSSAAGWQSSAPLATPKPFLSLQSEGTDFPPGPTAPLHREEGPVLGKAGKSLGAPAHSVTVCLSVNVTLTGSQ